MLKKKIHIYYRHYNTDTTQNRARPEWFDYETCFVNLLNTIEGDARITLNVVYDNSIKGSNWIHRYAGRGFNLIEFEGGSDWASFVKVGEELASHNFLDSDIIYLLENDYTHVHGWVDKVFEIFNTYSNLNYISLYDHNDKYFLPQYDSLTSKIISTKSHHWRTTPSTCASFIIDKDTYEKDRDILFTMPGDHNKFTWLSTHRDRFVLTPIPGLSTHCMEGLLSPTIDWQQISLSTK
jgi:hypothetical protein